MSRPDMENLLEDMQANLRHYEEQVARARTTRDTEITRAHVEAGISMYRIAQVIGISQQAVANIVKTNS